MFFNKFYWNISIKARSKIPFVLKNSRLYIHRIKQYKYNKIKWVQSIKTICLHIILFADFRIITLISVY
ncbi:MAG TPA: hypothetical protein DDX98_08835 [Bacteroidales bacterium]|nr:hypothetical protein [Bacteroidales bacterium]